MGERSPSSHGVVQKSSILPAATKLALDQLSNEFYPIEIDPLIPFPVKVAAMVQWWTRAHDLIISANLTKSHFTQMVMQVPVAFREGLHEFLVAVNTHSLPILVFSAGLADVIEIILKTSGFYSAHMSVVSNRMIFSESGDGECIGFSSPLIHTFNKSESAISCPIHSRKIENRPHIILLGDSIGDLQMTANISHDVQIKIGFLNHDHELLIEEYENQFDVVITNDSSLKWVTELLSLLE